MNRTVDGVEVALVHASKAKHLPRHGLPTLRRGHYWLETTWTFRNITDQAVHPHRPFAATNHFTARAFAPDAPMELDPLQPHQSRRAHWFFQIPRPATGVWIRYGSGTGGSIVIWYHLKLRA